MNKLENIPLYEKPYNKMLLYGESKLTNSELLSIIIRTGTKNLSAIEIAQNLIKKYSLNYNDMRFLQQISIKECMKFEGIGKVKAIELKAIGEISKRIGQPISERKLCIKSKSDIDSIFMEELRNEKVEKIKLVMLNNKNKIEKILTIAIGNTDGITFDIKQVLSEPIKLEIPKIIIVHNHPSGNPEPSRADLEFTKKLYEAAYLMGIQLLDHIIIGDGISKSLIWKG